jgi:DNA-binding CsgD family transcriptional regulator
MNGERLDDGEMLGLLKLANRLHELPANIVVQHEFMLHELCAMTGASAGISTLIDAPPREAANVLFLVHHGLDHAQQQWAMNRYLRALDEPLSAPAPLVRLLESRGWEHSRRVNGDYDDFLRDARELCRSLNLGPGIFSALPLPPTRLISIVSLHRPLSEPRPFTLRQRRLVQLFHSEIGWTFRAHAPVEPAEASRLSPRQQQTLRHLLAGESEKQIAQKLSRSPHTVHTYVKAIYRNFRVSSRGELLSLFVK